MISCVKRWSFHFNLISITKYEIIAKDIFHHYFLEILNHQENIKKNFSEIVRTLHPGQYLKNKNKEQNLHNFLIINLPQKQITCLSLLL